MTTEARLPFAIRLYKQALRYPCTECDRDPGKPCAIEPAVGRMHATRSYPLVVAYHEGFKEGSRRAAVASPRASDWHSHAD